MSAIRWTRAGEETSPEVFKRHLAGFKREVTSTELMEWDPLAISVANWCRRRFIPDVIGIDNPDSEVLFGFDEIHQEALFSCFRILAGGHYPSRRVVTRNCLDYIKRVRALRHQTPFIDGTHGAKDPYNDE